MQLKLKINFILKINNIINALKKELILLILRVRYHISKCIMTYVLNEKAKK